MIRSESKRSFAVLERTTKWRPRCNYPEVAALFSPSNRILNKLNENTFYHI